MKITIGTKEGKKVTATYSKTINGLPELRLSTGESYRGSSLGPANYQSAPSVEDVLYWQSLAGIPEDRAQAKRSLAAVRAARARESAPFEKYMDELIACHCGKMVTRWEIKALGECNTCSSDRH